jgi:hypothetical protein
MWSWQCRRGPSCEEPEGFKRISWVLQADAEYMARAGLEAGSSLMFFHVPGTIEEGMDGAGRGGARRIIGLACSPWTRKAVQALCAQQGGILQLILLPPTLTSSSNASLPGQTNQTARSRTHSPSDPRMSPSANAGAFIAKRLSCFLPFVWSGQSCGKHGQMESRVSLSFQTAYKAGYGMALRYHSVAMAELNDRASNSHRVQAQLDRHTIFLVDLGGPDTRSGNV